MSEFDTREQIVKAFGESAPDEIESEEQYKDWVDNQFAELKAHLDLLDERQDEIEEFVSEVSRSAASGRSDLAERVEHLEEAINSSSNHADARRERVIQALYNRCQTNDRICYITPSSKVVDGMYGEQRHLDGVYGLFDSGVSKRTCRNYMNQIADEYAGCHTTSPTRGGAGGGSSQLRLKMDVDEFVDQHGDEFDWAGN